MGGGGSGSEKSASASGPQIENPVVSGQKGADSTKVAAPATRDAADYLKSMRELRAASRAAFDSNHPVEALRHLVGLIAIDAENPPDRDKDRAGERAELVRSADAELTAIGARCTLEPVDEWIVDGKQTSGNVRDLAKGRGLSPAVRLVINYDYGKAVVPDAPIRFAFADGLGELTASENTDAYGVASATVRGIARTDRPLVVRAILAVSNRGITRVFPEVVRDFAYLPQRQTIRVLAMERVVNTEKKTSIIGDFSPLVDAVSGGLAGTGLEITPADGALDPASFIAALGGDPAAVARAVSLGGASVSYLAIVLAESDEPRQMTYQGKTYEIYNTIARTSVRLLRSDGSVILAKPQISTRGQGGTPDAALKEAFKAAGDSVRKELAASAVEIRKSLD